MKNALFLVALLAALLPAPTGAAGKEGAVKKFTLKSGGHTWPGGLQYLPQFIIGKTSDEMSASDEIWRFFMRHAMPAKR